GKRDPISAVLAMTMGRIDQCNRRAFGQSISFDQLSSGSLLETCLYLSRQSCASADAEADRRNIFRGQFWISINGVIHRGNTTENRGSVLLDVFSDVCQLETRQQQHGRAGDDTQMHAGGHSVAVKERQDTQEYLPSLVNAPQPRPGLIGIDNHIPMGQLCAL